MKKKLKVTLVVFLVVVLGCFSNIFAATNQSNKIKKIAEIKKNVKLLDNTTDDGGVVGTSNLNGTTDNSAKAGERLISPEIGWKRYDDSNKNIDYKGEWFEQSNDYFFNNKFIYTNADNDTVSFNFVGTKLRVIGSIDKGRPDFIIKIDDETYNATENGALCCYESIVFEKLNLTNKEHKVTITIPTITRGSVGYFILDAVDIDSIGYLVDRPTDLTTGISLNKTTDSLTVGQTDTLTATVAPNDAINKNVTWKSSDNNIATVDSMGRVTAIGAGTATITATTADGKTTSCTVTVKDKETGKSKLTLYMNDNTIREFYLTQEEIDDFIDWYTSKSKGEVTVQPYYVFNVSVPGKSSTKKSYVWFMKIESFEVE